MKTSGNLLQPSELQERNKVQHEIVDSRITNKIALKFQN